MKLFRKKKIFVIAEMANSHEGNLSQAKKIVECASKAGADAIKFQKFTADEYVDPNHEDYELFKKLEMTKKEWKELIGFTKKKKIEVFVDVFGTNSAKSLDEFNIDGYKIHSADVSNPYLLNLLANTKKPILLSTAGCLLNEIDESLKKLLKTPKEIVLMHGFQGFPTKLADTNLLRIPELKRRYDFPIGIMDHISGDSKFAQIMPLLGICMGAIVVEKHLTLNRSKKGLDYQSSLNPDEFQNLVSLIRLTEKSLGRSNFNLTPNELSYRQFFKKNPISKHFIKKGTKLNETMFKFKRTKIKQNSVSIYDFQGRKSSKNIPSGSTLVKKMLSKEPSKIAAVIACRTNSLRLYGKQLQQVGGYPIIHLLLTQLKKSSLIDEIVLAISTGKENEIFINFATEHGLKFIIGDEIDVLQRLIDGAKYVNADLVFRITPENPYIYWQGIDALIKKHISGNFDFSYIIDVPLGSGFEVINLGALEISHKNGSKKHRSELCSLYIYEHKDKFKIHSFLELFLLI